MRGSAQGRVSRVVGPRRENAQGQPEMPEYRFNGFGRTTGRKRCRTYVADTLEEAIQIAHDDGTIVQVPPLEISPEEPATDRQIRFAKELGLPFIPGDTKRHMKKRLDTALEQADKREIERNLAPTEAQLDFAAELCVRVPRGMKRRELSKIIDQALDEEASAAICSGHGVGIENREALSILGYDMLERLLASVEKEGQHENRKG